MRIRWSLVPAQKIYIYLNTKTGQSWPERKIRDKQKCQILDIKSSFLESALPLYADLVLVVVVGWDERFLTVSVTPQTTGPTPTVLTDIQSEVCQIRNKRTCFSRRFVWELLVMDTNCFFNLSWDGTVTLFGGGVQSLESSDSSPRGLALRPCFYESRWQEAKSLRWVLWFSGRLQRHLTVCCNNSPKKTTFLTVWGEASSVWRVQTQTHTAGKKWPLSPGGGSLCE